MEELKIGVTPPAAREARPGRPRRGDGVEGRAAGAPTGYWESYKSEIAGYELDKLLGPRHGTPSVERRIKGELGAAVMWCTPTRSFKDMGGVPSAPPEHFAAFNRQLVRAKMFDNLIGNLDPNLGNWLVDPAWNLILIDHTRAFTSARTWSTRRWTGSTARCGRRCRASRSRR